MAEIKIEKKSTVWPWILLGLLVLALLLYFLVFRNDNNNNDQTASTMVVTDSSAAAGDSNTARPLVVHDAVADYIAYVNNTHDMDETHEYTHEALLMLIDAVRTKANQVNVDLTADLDQAQHLADKITTDPNELSHANSIHQAVGNITNALQHLQQTKFPNLDNEMQSVQQAAGSIRPDKPTLEQKDNIKTFFDRSAALLQKM